MPSSSKSCGFSSRAVISSNWYASVATPSPFPRIGRGAYPHPQTTEGAIVPFELPPLPYDYSALEPHIDEQTMRIHHDKHHQAYVDNANAALQGTPLEQESVEQVL